MDIETLCENIYEDLEGNVSQINSTYMGLSFVYETNHWDNFDNRIKLLIECEDVVDSTIKLDAGGSFRLFEEHPVLDDYIGDAGGLYFSTKPENPNEIIGLLYQAHDSYFLGWRELSKYINTQLPLTELLENSGGSIANAPIKVLNHYKDAISGYLKVNIVKSHTMNGNYKMLAVEDTYIVCKTIKVSIIN